jgi:D-3-phosphoglycerate dehydrogenase
MNLDNAAQKSVLIRDIRGDTIFPDPKRKTSRHSQSCLTRLMAMPTRPTIVIPSDDPVQIGQSLHLERLRQRADVVLYATRASSPEEQLRRAEPADLLINSRGYLKWPGELLRRLPRLRMISTCSIGTDSIDLAAARELGIVVSNIPGKTAPVVAEHALALILATAKRVAYQTAELRAGRWRLRYNTCLAGKTLGLVGAGAIAAAVARLARAIGMDVIAWTFRPSPERAAELGVRFVELDDLLRTSDVVSLHVRLTDQSRGMIGQRELALMKPGALLINTARGAVVDSAALVSALESGHLGGAGLDVFHIEPLPADHPILRCEQVVLTPHHADQTPEGVELLNLGAVENVLAYLDGRPRNVAT